MSDKLTELKAKEKEAVLVLSSARKDLKEYWQQSHYEKYGVEPGVIVQLDDGKKAIVVSVESRETVGRPWAEGRVEKKNGDFGKAVRHLYSHWTVLTS